MSKSMTDKNVAVRAPIGDCLDRSETFQKGHGLRERSDIARVIMHSFGAELARLQGGVTGLGARMITGCDGAGL